MLTVWPQTKRSEGSRDGKHGAKQQIRQTKCMAFVISVQRQVMNRGIISTEDFDDLTLIMEQKHGNNTM
jgi:hypothetical protein